MQPAHTHPTMSCIHSVVSMCNIYVRIIWFDSKRSVQVPVQGIQADSHNCVLPNSLYEQCSGTADQLTAFSLNVSTSGFSVVGLEDVPWVPWKHPLNNYLAFITVQITQ